ncbi:MAG: transposase [Candidatus Brevundimonas colombiensis]|uniref:Transposase n=1 Tax=Candidatus Brevundimonas colombiensis TaxID=3121376 RepID=A0AAJ5WVT9_9CAUL|nr:transposase [Brevundimonas sp.]WEK39206.1 MAG: transposase [Brevundimonas sp.]
MLTDEAGRPRVLQLSPGQASDIVAAHDLIVASRPSLRLLADRAYDGDALRRMLKERGTTPVIPNKINRVNRHPFDAVTYRLSNAVERAFCRLKDFRADPPSFEWTPMLAFRSWRGVSDECSRPGVSGFVQAGGC